MYGIYNKVAKKFQFGISEPTKDKAYAKLYKKIGNDSNTSKFEARIIPNTHKLHYTNKGGNSHGKNK